MALKKSRRAAFSSLEKKKNAWRALCRLFLCHCAISPRLYYRSRDIINQRLHAHRKYRKRVYRYRALGLYVLYLLETMHESIDATYAAVDLRKRAH